MTSDKVKMIRCAVYTRKSTEEGLEAEFNSLDAQREAGEAYINSQRGEGWVCLPARYDDGGFTGGNMERPALKKLMADIEKGLIDCCVVYKVDRLSRSLLDFTTMIDKFDKNNVTFVSVTQSFCTTTSMGRLTLNILLSFAQFEREIIGERIRDKVTAAKRKGKHTGGFPILGYDSVDTKLVVNKPEAKIVRDIFQRFLILRSPVKLSQELNAQKITMKTWKTGKGTIRPGSQWTKNGIHTLLRNRRYIGEVRHFKEYFPGEHEPIIDRKLWDQVQQVIEENSNDHIRETHNQTPALLKGIIKCGHCGCSMGITYTKNHDRVYRYYQCMSASKKGYSTCPVKIVPAGEIEAAAVEQMRKVLRSSEMLAKAHLAVEESGIDPKEFASALRDVDAVWKHLFPLEQARICRLLLDKVIVNTDKLAIHLRRCGISSLVSEFLEDSDE